MYSREQYNDAICAPVIVHFTNSFFVQRPWVTGKKNRHPFSEIWEQYKNKSLWAGDEAITKKASLRCTIEQYIQKMPRQLVVSVMGALYCYIKPVKYLIRRKRCIGTKTMTLL